MAEDGNAQLQFDRVEGTTTSAAAVACAACQRTVPDVYYEAVGKIFCAQCADAALATQTGGSRIARLVKALFLGSIAAAISAAVWYGIVKLTGYELGIVAIAVGIAVGMAVRFGSEGRGGWAYQLIAVLLTYLAIGASYVPLAMEGIREELTKESSAEVEGAEAEEPMNPEARELAVILGGVVFGLAYPVLQVMDGGFIGTLIVGFALFEAWRINKRRALAFNGPFRVDAPSPASAA